MRLFVIGIQASEMMVRTALDGILVMHERASDQPRQVWEIEPSPMVITGGRPSGIDAQVSGWFRWYRRGSASLITLEEWLATNEVAEAAFKLNPTHVLAFYPRGYESISDYDRTAYQMAHDRNIPTWTFQGGDISDAEVA